MEHFMHGSMDRTPARRPLPSAPAVVLLILLAATSATAQPNDATDQVVERARYATELTKLRDGALEILTEASRSDRPVLRANAIEAMQMMPERALPMARRGLNDPNPAVRFAAVVTAGMLGFESLAGDIEPLVEDANPSVRAAAMYALHKFGRDINITPLAGMLSSQDPGLRANVAMILGLMGDESAIPMLREAGTRPMPRVSEQRVAVVRIQIAEAMARLGDDGALNSLRAGAHSSIGEVRVVAINAIGAVGDEKGAAMMQVLLENQPVEVRLAAAGALARVARKQEYENRNVGQWLKDMEDKARPMVLKESRSDRDAHRAQAAWVLGWFNDVPTLNRITEMMKQEDGPVQLYAATSGLRRALRDLGQSGGRPDDAP